MEFQTTNTTEPIIQYSSSTSFGHIEVQDHYTRDLIINGKCQGRVDLKTGYPTSWYMLEILRKAASYTFENQWNYKEAKSALVLGGGAFILTTELLKLGYTVDTIEQNKELIQVAQFYFKLDTENTNSEIIIGNANNEIFSLGKYGVIIVDLFNGHEERISQETVVELYKHLNPFGHILTNRIYGIGKQAIVEETLCW